MKKKQYLLINEYRVTVGDSVAAVHIVLS